MLHWTQYIGHNGDIVGIRKKVDNTVYTLDIETTSFIIFNNEIYPAIKYKDLSKEEQENCEFYANMYIWMFSINSTVYYGRTWQELKEFISLIDKLVPEQKILFIHNASFEFQFLKSYFSFKDMIARKSHKVMRCSFTDYNFEVRCSYLMSNASLDQVAKMYNIHEKYGVKKLVGNLNYNLLRHSKTKLTDKELAYCENDCLVVYYYILEELETYTQVNKIPITSTGHVRKELKDLVMRAYSYKRKVGKAINVDPHIYNVLLDAFAGRLFTCELSVYRLYYRKC